MVIELRGVDFINKGAELMLLSIISKLKEEFPRALFVMEKSRNAPRLKHLQYGIYTKTNFRKFKIPFKYILSLIPSFLQKRLHYINEKEINVVLDASGFAFGDVWGAKYASARLGKHVAKWKDNGKKIILLPQAFGPFSSPELIEVMKNIIHYVDLLFVRDKKSLKYLEQITADTEKLILAPDFTNLIKGTIPSYFDNSKYEVAIIVNSKMIETTINKNGEAYFDLIFRIIKLIENSGYKPYFLIHEGKKDRKVAETINQNLETKIPLIEEDNPLFVKGMIEKSRAVITSRFHGLVSCLSQAVPCLATAWSHKYEMLLKDYNYPEALINVDCGDDLLMEKIKSVLTEPTRQSIVNKLKDKSLIHKKLTEEMWKIVTDKIKGNKGALLIHNNKPIEKLNYQN